LFEKKIRNVLPFLKAFLNVLTKESKHKYILEKVEGVGSLIRLPEKANNAQDAV
jgi:hypothetical protein